jgi:hypothetical protein
MIANAKSFNDLASREAQGLGAGENVGPKQGRGHVESL